MSIASTSDSESALWNAVTSSAEYSRGRHARGLWLKNWMALQRRSTPRWTAFAGPPAGETCAPISIGTGRPRSVACCVHAREVPSVADRGAAHRQREDGTVQLAPGAGSGRADRAADRGHRPPAVDAGERPGHLRRARVAGHRLGRGAG